MRTRSARWTVPVSDLLIRVSSLPVGRRIFVSRTAWNEWSVGSVTDCSNSALPLRDTPILAGRLSGSHALRARYMRTACRSASMPGAGNSIVMSVSPSVGSSKAPARIVRKSQGIPASWERT